jgi:hypothetical protein
MTIMDQPVLPKTAVERPNTIIGDGSKGRGAYTRRAKRLISIVWASTSILIVAAWLSAIMLAQRDGNDTLLRAQRDTSNLTRIIAEQTARVISGTDRILNYIAFDVHRFGTHSPNLRDVMKNATEGSELLLQLSYTDASGDLIQTSIDGSPARINLADREHFRVHREGKVECFEPKFGSWRG